MSENNIKDKILSFSNANNEPSWLKESRIDSYRIIDDYNHPSFGPEIKLDIDLVSYCGNKSIPFCLEEDGFIACDIHTAFSKYKGLVDKYYSKLILNNENRYTVLNSTVFESGYFIYVFKNQKLNFPIFNQNLNCDFSKNIIVVDENAELNIIDYYGGNANFKCECTEIFVEKGAKCKYLNLNSSDEDSTVVSIKRAQIEENGIMNWLNIVSDSKIYMGYPTSILKGRRASSSSITLSLAGENKSVNVGSKMIHEGCYTTSAIKNIGYVKNNGELEVRNLVDIKSNSIKSRSTVEYEYCANGKNSKYDNVPRYINSNDSSDICFNAKSISRLDIDLMSFIEQNFMKLTKKNKKILQELIKKSI